MTRSTLHLGIGIRIWIGFVVVLGLMVALSSIGLRYVAEANQRLKEIAQNNNIKTELATVMQSALRERALSMHALPILIDPFDKDAEVQRFYEQGALYVEARSNLEKMPLNQKEKDILAKIRDLTREAQPEVQAVVDMSTFSDDQEKTFKQIYQQAMPKQRAIANQVMALVELQREQTGKAVESAERSYINVRNLMVFLGLSALILGMMIATFVSRRSSRQARQLADQAMYDTLTGLANRCLLNDRLEHEIALSNRMNSSFGVLLMDLDKFKEVNDTLGHNVGDELLVEIGRRLKKTVRADDTVARLGGDEYVILLHDLARNGVPVIAKKVLDALNEPFVWHGQRIDLSASLGISLYPDQCSDASGLIRCADIAMYVAKRSGTGFLLYAPDQERTSRNDLSLKSELREAIQSDQLCLHYQPQIEHKSQRVVGIEALIRWNHPKRGFLSPDKFVRLAEEGGLIGLLTQWVLKTALDNLMTLQENGHRLNVAVNLSALSLRDMRLAADVQDLLGKSGVDPRQLTLEITESAVMSNPSDGLKILTELDRMGITLSIDDFGTGYSSLAYLKRLPVDELKIDKSFVMDMETNENDAVIVCSTIDLAHNLGMKVTAEGVENQHTLDKLHALGCDYSQGYLIARPMPFEQLESWLQHSAWSGISKGHEYAAG